jgi:hypothetical protein
MFRSVSSAVFANEWFPVERKFDSGALFVFLAR